MNPKMTCKDAADCLGVSARQLFKELIEAGLPYSKVNGAVCFGYSTSRQLFRMPCRPQAISFQIVKGGTGKTSLACAVAIRANLYGLKVLCIDLDQQGNLTNSFGVDAESLPVMIDILAEGYSYEEAITKIYPGLDLLGSRIENALLDDVIKLKRLSLDQVYRVPLAKLKEKYDLIVIDCPPNLGNSVSAVTLGVDKVVAPVVLESYALSGLRATKNAIKELQQNYKTNIALQVTINKYDPRAVLSQEALQVLANYPSRVHVSQDFPNSMTRGESIFDTVKSNQIKRDVDILTRELLGIDKQAIMRARASQHSNFEESFA